MRDVKYFLPNLKPDREVLLFYGYECVEHFPFKCSALLGSSFADCCQKLDVSLPFDCKYAYYRRNHFNTTLKEVGPYLLIINTKITLPQNEQNPSS